jgi:hypothetical protein
VSPDIFGELNYIIFIWSIKLKSRIKHRHKQNKDYRKTNTMKPIETLFWLGTAGVLYMTANTIVKNVARDIIYDIEKYHIERKEHRR